MKKRFKQKRFEKAVSDEMFRYQYCAKRHIGLREFADSIGVSAATLSRIERGGTPDLETFFKLCCWMGVDAKKFYVCKKNKA